MDSGFNESDNQIIEIGPTALEAIERAEVDIQIRTAKQYPRNPTTFKSEVLALAKNNQEIAETMFYSIPRGGKKIEGPSVRLAEIVGHCWGNLRYASSIVSIEDKFVVARGVAHDLEKNVAMAVEVRRKITDKAGKRFNDDMINVTCNAATSIAIRQAIFKVVPFSMIKSIYDEARKTALGQGSFSEVRDKFLNHFRGLGVKDQQIFSVLDVKGVSDLTYEHVVSLRGLQTAIEDGEISLKDAFEVPGQTGGKVARGGVPEKKASDATKEDGDG